MNKLGAANDAISKYASDKIAEIAKRSNIPGDKLAGVLSNSDARNLKTILTKPLGTALNFSSLMQAKDKEEFVKAGFKIVTTWLGTTIFGFFGGPTGAGTGSLLGAKYCNL